MGQTGEGSCGLSVLKGGPPRRCAMEWKSKEHRTSRVCNEGAGD